MSRNHHQNAAAPSHRMLRVAELIRHTVSDLFARNAIDDPALAGRVLSVPRVQMSPDLKLATVYVLPLGGEGGDVIVAALDRHRKYLRGEIAHRINLKFAPDVRFRFDTTFDNVARIEQLFHSEKVRQDLAGSENESDDGPENP